MGGKGHSDNSEGKEVSDGVEKAGSDGSEGSEAQETTGPKYAYMEAPLTLGEMAEMRKDTSPLSVFFFN